MEVFKESTIILVATPVFTAVILLELTASWLFDRGLYTRQGVIENLWLTLLNMGLDILMRGIALIVLDFSYRHRLTEIDDALLYWIALLIAEDFLFYWLHWVDHHCRFFWAAHVTHHSSKEFNFTVGFRSSVLQPLYRFVYFIPLAALGFHGIDIFFMYSVTQIYGILIHTQLVHKLGWLEHVLVTPSHHRVHHGSNIEYLDKNLGMMFIFWDKLFGTFVPEKEKVSYGLTENLESVTLANVVFHEWKSISKDLKKSPRMRHKLQYVLGPPGWSHDGSKKTTKQLQQDGNCNRSTGINRNCT